MLPDKFLEIDDFRIRYKESSVLSDKAVVLLHGRAFTCDTWDKLGTLKILEENKIPFIALDMPSFGKSSGSLLNRHEAAELLKEILVIKGIKKVILVGPSMGGGIALSFAIRFPEYLLGLVLIAPAGLSDPKISGSISSISVPVLIIWGDKDDVFPVSEAYKLNKKIPNSTLVICSNARHPCYLDTPEIFHEALLDFLMEILK